MFDGQPMRRLIGGIYRIGQVMSNTGMLITCTAYNHITNEVVGLFLVEFPSTFHPQTVRQLLQSVEQRRSIHSPHVLRVHDWGIDGSRIYIATDPPRGVTLQHVLDNENISLARAVNLTCQIVMGLKALHEKNLSGLDMRPRLVTVDVDNINDRVQLDDIGLRTILNALGYMSGQQGDLEVLDPRYAPPEFINGDLVGPWSDIYQAGLLLFELITGRPPFVGRNNAETGVFQSTSPVPRMTQFKHNTPDILQEIVDTAMAKEPRRRFGSAAALLKALEDISLPPLERSGPSSAQSQGQSSVPLALTNEMPRVEQDVTLQSTLIEKNLPARIPSEQLPLMLDDEEIYAFLCYESDGNESRYIPIKQRNIIVGRLDPKRGFAPDIDLSTFDPDMTISRQHARIRFEEAFFYIEDLKSRNKTRLGALALTPLKAELLQHGDTISFGSVRLRFRVPGLFDPPEFKERPMDVE